MASLRTTVPQACSRAMAVADELPTGLPPAFLAFLHKNGLDASIYAAAAKIPRYVRVKPQAETTAIEEELGMKLSPLAWLPNFFSLPPEAQIASTHAYQQGKLYGMDAASGAAVAALGIESGDHVLDLCAAPGAKLCMMAELLGGSGSLTAVDIARPRLAACRTMLQKYGLGRRARLYLSDGTTFSLLPLSGVTMSCSAHVGDNHCHGVDNFEDGNSPGHNEGSNAGNVQKSARSKAATLYGEWRSGRTRQEKRAAKRAKFLGIPQQVGEDQAPELFFYGVDSGVVGMKVANVAQTCRNSQNTSHCGYDKVLVDAECTHDGSLKHITKFEQWGWETFERRFLNEERISSITSLQLRLLSNGFRLLNPGGTLVYSTCSFTKDQNEGVVERFLATHSVAELQEVEIAKQWPCRPGGLPHTLRFDPVASNTSGLFIAKLRKLSLDPPSKPENGER